MREGRAEGYGVGPRAAARRAAEVKSVTRSPATPERPMAWVVLCGVVAVICLIYLIVRLSEYWSGGQADLAGFVVAGAVYGASVWGFCYGWELYDVGKATRLAVILGVFGLAVLIVAALVLVAMAESSDGDVDLGDMGKAFGGAGRAAAAKAGDVADVVVPVLAQDYVEAVPARDDARRDEQETAAEAPPQDAAGLAAALAAVGPAQTGASDRPPSPAVADPSEHTCPACGHRFDPAGRLACPSCGRPV